MPGGVFGNVGSLLAVGCPVCNKLVVAALGVSGALSGVGTAPAADAMASLGLMGWAVWRRLSTPSYCPIPVVGAGAAGGVEAQSSASIMFGDWRAVTLSPLVPQGECRAWGSSSRRR